MRRLFYMGVGCSKRSCKQKSVINLIDLVDQAGLKKKLEFRVFLKSEFCHQLIGPPRA